jgi:hypothetical protein
MKNKKRLLFERECNNIVIDLHVRVEIVEYRHVSVEIFEFHIRKMS